MKSTPRRVFISRVSRELGSYAEELRNALESVEIASRTQLTFRQESDTETTLEKLSKYITESDVVLCLIGTYSGGFPADAILGCPIFPTHRKDRTEQTWGELIPKGLTRLSYAQWEVILARYWGKTYFLYQASDHSPDQEKEDPEIDDLDQQKEFIDLFLRGIKDRASFKTPDRLCRNVLCDLWPPEKRDKDVNTVIDRYEKKLDALLASQDRIEHGQESHRRFSRRALVVTLGCLALVGGVLWRLWSSQEQGNADSKEANVILIHKFERMEETLWHERTEPEADERKRKEDLAAAQGSEIIRLLKELQKPAPVSAPIPATAPDVSPELQKAFAQFTELDGKDLVAERLTAGRELIHIGSSNPRAWFLFGYAAFHAGKSTPEESERRKLLLEAVNAAKEAIRLIDERNTYRDLLAVAWSNLAGALAELGKANEAETAATKAISIDPKQDLAWTNLAYAVSLQEPNGKDRRLNILREARETLPDSTAVKENLVDALYDAMGGTSDLTKLNSIANELLPLADKPFGVWILKFYFLCGLANYGEADKALSEARVFASTPFEEATIELQFAKLSIERAENEGEKERADAEAGEHMRVAWEIISRALKNSPDDGDALSLAAVYYYLRNERPEGDSYFARIPTSFKDNEYGFFARKARLDNSLKDFQHAAKFADLQNADSIELFNSDTAEQLFGDFRGMLESTEETQSEEFSEFFQLAFRLLISEKWVELTIRAENYIPKAREGVERGGALLLLAFAQHALGDFEAAVGNFEAAFGQHPPLRNSALSYFGDALMNIDRLSDAEAVFREDVERSPAKASAQFNLALVLEKLGEYEEGSVILKRLLGKGAPPALESATEIRKLLYATVWNHAVSLVRRLEVGSGSYPVTETRLKIDDLLEEARSYQEDRETLHGIGDVQAENLLWLVGNKEHRERIDRFIGDRRAEEHYPQDCSELQAIEGWQRYQQVKTDLVSQPRTEREETRRLMINGMQAGRPVNYFFDLARLRLSLGEVDDAIKEIQGEIDGVPPRKSEEGKILRLSMAAQALSAFYVDASGNPNRSIGKVVRNYLEEILRLEKGETAALTAEGWSMLSAVQRLDGDFAKSGVSAKTALSIDSSRYGDWINLSDTQLRNFKFHSATKSSVMAFRHFPWSQRSDYFNIAPMIGNFFFATSPVLLLTSLYFGVRYIHRRKICRLLA